MRKTLIGLSLLLLAASNVKASDSLSTAVDSTALDSISMQFIDEINAYFKFKDSLDNALNFELGSIQLGDDLATLNVPSNFMYLGKSQSIQVLTDVWGNPPDQSVLGMMIPKNTSVLDDSTYAIIISYSEEGYVDDEDAEDLDYDELMETMQGDAQEANPMRIQQGYPSIEVIGWAAAPFYDSENKKLHWAKELSFDHDSAHTLNYNVRILGRRGYLELNFISDLQMLDQIKAEMPEILPAVNFNEGNRYSDFNPDMDKVAAYGIGGLIAGKVLAKAGLFVLLAKFWKIIAVGAVALFAGIRKFMGGKKNEPVNTIDKSEEA
ncbi:DUF2167 domain-containing protein [Croceimicrobium hydrocarbonivorans]|uniref:DUF2167 domain-containing protein n=1 Tax=Croceimicrobium hydrocarbonivorans TaxID=2761580 RepID=A0A7H0VFS2_9FLAO|nr:DUF2167 domain-containing protein [Croceimicrobium hydrocarbonivorans]QNR24570.1 DUF2167 domain-containing protein [Croceimicrobium hydrocarbonivorans]